jgi:hypothetical protein
MEKELHDIRVQIVAPQSWLEMVETWRKNHPKNISRSEAIRLMTENAFRQSAA